MTGGAPFDDVAVPYTTSVGWLFGEVIETGLGQLTAGPCGNGSTGIGVGWVELQHSVRDSATKSAGNVRRGNREQSNPSTLSEAGGWRLEAGARPFDGAPHEITEATGSVTRCCSDQNVKRPPPSVGIFTSTTFERSFTGEPLPSVRPRQSPATTKKPIVSPTAG